MRWMLGQTNWTNCWTAGSKACSILRCSSLDVELELLWGRNARLLTSRLLLLLVFVGYDVFHDVLHEHAAPDFALMVSSYIRYCKWFAPVDATSASDI